MCSEGEKVRKTSSKQEEEEAEKLPEREESLLKKDKKALRSKKRYEKHLKFNDCAFNAMRLAQEQIDSINKMNQLLDIAEEDSKDPDMSDGIDTSKSFEVEFDMDELLAEHERLEKSLDKNLFESDGMDERVQCTEVPPTALPSQSAEAGGRRRGKRLSICCVG